MKNLAAVVVFATASFAAQSARQAGEPIPLPSPAVSTARELWKIASDNVLAAAQQMPEANYDFKPTPDVRSFGQIIGHVTNGQQLLCGMALGQAPTEKTATSKAELVAGLEASIALCGKAYAMSDAESFKPLSAAAQKAWKANGFGDPKTQLFALMMNAWHDNEHYGNIVTYMRLKGMVPPSSQPRK